MDSPLLTYAAPPLLGAFIGYLTNKIAIRMLFRPLRRWQVLGMPVPMTPGVIPAKRHELAHNIGEMVGAHLLTSADIGNAMSEERFQDHLRRRVDDWVRELLTRDLGPIPALVPERFRVYVKIGVRTLKYQARQKVHRAIQGDAFAVQVSAAVLEQLQALGTRPLNTLISRDERQAAYRFLDTLTAELLAGDGAVTWLSGHLRESLRQAAAEERTVADYLPGPLQELVLETVRRRSPEILRHLATMLAEPPVRERIIAAARGAIENFISTLGPLGLMARGFLNMDRLEAAIRDYLGGREGEIQAWLDNEEVQDHFGSILAEQAGKLLRTPVARLLAGTGEERLAAVSDEAARQILALLNAPGVQASLAALLRERFEELLRDGEEEVGVLGGQILGAESVAGLQGTIAGEVVALLRSQRVASLLDRMLGNMIDALAERPVGILGRLLPDGVRAGFVDYAVVSLNRILLREVPSIVDSLNIRRVVTAKVDSLDLLRLERLLLSIMEEQFKYINLFGALLGFLIGLLNLLPPLLR